MSIFGQSANTASNPYGSSTQTKPTLSFGVSQPQQSPSLFGQAPAQGQQSGGLFGSTNNAQTQGGGGLFGSNPTTQPQQQQQQQQNSGGLFGSSAQPQQSGGLFGSAQPQQNQQTGGGLFGSAQSSQPQQTSGLFGQSLQQNNTSSNMFGNTQSAQAGSQPQQQRTLFGPTMNNNTLGQKPSLSLFGNSTNQPQPQQQQQQQTSQHQGLSLPSLSMGQTNRPQQTVPGVRIDASNIRSTTRFNDLHDDIQAQIEKFDAFIQQQINFREQCDAMMPSHEQNLGSIPADVVLVSGLVDTSELGIINDSSAIKQAKDLVLEDAETARTSFRAIETMKLPSQLRNPNTWYSAGPRRDLKQMKDAASSDEPQPQDIVDYFSTEAGKMTRTLERYEKYIGEIEGHLQNVESSTVQAGRQMQFTQGKNGAARSAEDQIRELAAVLKEFDGGIRGVADKVSNTRDEVQKLTMQGHRRR